MSDYLISAIFGARRHTMQRCREVEAHKVQEAINDFPVTLFEDEELPVCETSPHRRRVHLFPLREEWQALGEPRQVRLFRLGEYRRLELDDFRGRTVLYLGSDGLLYEYGPAWRSSYELPAGLGDNLIALRYLDPEELEFHELSLCHDLLQRVWLV